MADRASSPTAGPVARSPIDAGSPSGVEDGWEVSLAESDTALRIADLTPLAKVSLRAAPEGAVAARLACPPGRAVRVASGELVVRLAPDEWLAIGAPGSAPAIAARWAGDPASGAEAPAGAEAPPGSEAPSGAAPADAADAAPTGAAAVHGAAAGIGGGAGGGLGRAPLVSAVDVTHQHVLLRVTGEQAALLLQKLCAVDLGDRAAPDGTAFRSSLARVHTAVVRDDRAGERSYLLASDRSSGQYLLGVLLDAGEELGAGVTGYRAGVAGA